MNVKTFFDCLQCFYCFYFFTERVNLGENEDVPVVEFMYLVFTCMPDESYCGCTSDGVYVPCIYIHAR